MAINFTDSPADGATQVIGGRTYTYNSTKNKWDTTATEVTGPTATVYANVDALPTSGNITGAQAYVSGNNRLYIWNGTGWYNIALINTAPSISGVSSSYALALDGTATTVTITATDPEGLPITYSIASDTSGNIATVTQSSNVFTITPTTNTANAGTFSLTFRASDGVNLATAVAEFTLVFKVSNSNYTTSLITTGGSAGTNSTFTDSSSNSYTVTANGNVNQSSFSPYRSGGYSAYFDGTTGTKLTSQAALDFSGAFTIEYWMNTTVGAAANTVDSSFGDQLYVQLFTDGTGEAKFHIRTGNTTFTRITGTTQLHDGKWHHLAAVRDSSGTMTLYVDGVSEGGTATETANIGTNQAMTIGAFDYQATAYDTWRTGYVRDFRVSSNARYSSNFTAPTEPLTSDSNTTLLTCHLPYFVDGSTNGYSITLGGNVSTKPFGPYDYQEYAVGDHGGSAYFDGSGDHLSTTVSAIGTGDFTFECWANFETLASNEILFSMGAYSPALYYRAASSELAIYHGSAFYTSGFTPKPNVWYHIAMVRESGSVKLYVNGQQEGAAQPYTTNITNTTCYIGEDTTSADYEGWISDARLVIGSAVYTSSFTPPTTPLTAITNTELLLNMQGAKILDKSQSATNLTLVGNTAASTGQYKYLPTSMYFDGTGDYINLNHSDGFGFGTGDFTIETWIYSNSAPTSYLDFAGNASNSVYVGSGRGGWVASYNGSSSWKFSYQYNSSWVFEYSFAGSFAGSTWYHIAFVRENGSIKAFLDGTQIGSAQSNTTNIISAEPLYIGTAFGNNGSKLNGYMSDFRVTKGLARYTANFTPPSAALDG